MQPFSTVLAVAILTLVVWQQASAQQAAPKANTGYPIVFTASNDLVQFGLSIEAHPSTPHQCYYYGDGGQLIRVSHERLLRYRDMGFTLNSLCLGLMSETLFDPETGKRLPTFIVVDPKSRANQVDATYEHPIELPPCFRRALVYSDCTFNYDRLTGKKLSEAKTRALREFGLALNKGLQKAIDQRLVCSWPFCTERRTGSISPGSIAAGAFGATICSNEGYLKQFIETTLAKHGIDVPKTILEETHVSCFDISINLPAGYGYTMDADGTASPYLSPEVLKAAIDPKRRIDQIDPKALADLLKAQQNPVTAPGSK